MLNSPLLRPSNNPGEGTCNKPSPRHVRLQRRAPTDKVRRGRTCETADRSNRLGTMKPPFTSYGAILSVFGFLAWISFSVRSELRPLSVQGSPASSDVAPSEDAPVLQEQTGGSAVPCAVPLAWRIARVDEAFGLSGAGARGGVEPSRHVMGGGCGPGPLFERVRLGACCPVCL